MSERQLDDAIDRAVRDMMSVDADGAFQARVLERLEQPKPRLGWRAMALAGAAASIVVISLMVTRTPEPAPVIQNVQRDVPAVTQGSAASARVEPPTGSYARRPGRAAMPRAARTAVSEQVPQGLISATIAPEQAVTIEPLQVIDPITVAPLERPLLAAEGVVVAPLEPIAEVQIAPLSTRVERD
jgi:hypothetical protein